MPDLVLPEASPPLITQAAKDKVLDRILEFGLTNMWPVALTEFRERQPVLTSQLLICDFLDKGSLVEDERPGRIFRTAVVVTEMAYALSGHEIPIENPTIFNKANLEAMAVGIPEAYQLKAVQDSVLQELTEVLLDTRELKDGADDYIYSDIVTIGAGYTRHYLQYAMGS